MQKYGKWSVSGILAVLLWVTACSDEGARPEIESTDGGPEFGTSWVTREVSVRTLSRMLMEEAPEEIVANIGDGQEELLETGILVQEEGGGYRVELDKDEWNVEHGTTGRLDSALYDAMDYNEVAWCGEPVNGVDFVDAYVDEFDGAFHSAEGYYSSIDDYVDCGTGQL